MQFQCNFSPAFNSSDLQYFYGDARSNVSSLCCSPCDDLMVTTSCSGDFKLWAKQTKEQVTSWRCRSVGSFKGKEVIPICVHDKKTSLVFSNMLLSTLQPKLVLVGERRASFYLYFMHDPLNCSLSTRGRDGGLSIQQRWNCTCHSLQDICNFVGPHYTHKIRFASSTRSIIDRNCHYRA